MKFSASLITVAIVICSAGQTVESQSPSTAPSLHALDASVEERYVEIQAVGEFPRRPNPVYTEIRRERTVLVPMRDGKVPTEWSSSYEERFRRSERAKCAPVAADVQS